MKIIFSYKNVIVLALIFRSPIHVELTFWGGGMRPSSLCMWLFTCFRFLFLNSANMYGVHIVCQGMCQCQG